MKKILKHLWFLGITMIGISSSNLYAAGCKIDDGPIPELTQYSEQISQELSELQSQNNGKNGECNATVQEAHLIFDAAYADLSALPQFVTDFAYNTKISAEGQARTPVIRDEKIFKQIEKKIESTAQSLAGSCGLHHENRVKLRDMIVEVNLLRNAYQKTALGTPPPLPPQIRDKSVATFYAITSAYHPSQTHSCENESPQYDDFTEKLKSVFSIGGKMEDALSTWRRALALLRGNGYGMTPTEHTEIQRRLLQAELSRQGLTKNMKQVILQNFNCFKAKTADYGGVMNALEARAQCMKNPILGVDKLFTGWRKNIKESKTMDEFSKRNEVKEQRKIRAVNVSEMYGKLVPMISFEQDVNDVTFKNLVDLHISIQATNNLLEERIKPMQNNCMKGQPDIVAGCRE